MHPFDERISKLSSSKQALLAALLKEKEQQRSQPDKLTIPRRARPDEPAPLSFAQQRLWVLEQFLAGSPVYNIPSALRLRGELDQRALEQALNEVIRRHEVLRTSFGSVEGHPVQIVQPAAHTPLPVTSLESVQDEERAELVRQWLHVEGQRSFDLQQGPLVRAHLLRLDDHDHILSLTMHHIVSDGWSVGVLMRELITLYQAFVSGQAPADSPLPELPIQYADFAIWQRDWLQEEALAQQIQYWQGKLANLEVLDLPADYRRPARQSYHGTVISHQFPPELSAALNRLAQAQGVTLYMILLAAFQTLLYRYTGQTDISVGSAIANRNHTEIESLIGFFINMLVMRADLAGDPSFAELLQQVRQSTLEAYANQDAPFEKLVEALHVARDPSRPPLFQVVLTLQNAPMEPLALPRLTVEPIEVKQETSRFDLAVTISESPQGLLVHAEFNTDLFTQATIDRLLRHYRQVLEEVAADPSQRVAELPLLTADERQQMLDEWNRTARPFSTVCVHERIARQAAATPDAVAVTLDDQQLSYGELDRRANQLAQFLRARGVGPEAHVGLCVERSFEMIVGILGILKAGAAYVPLDPSYPADRLSYMLADASINLVLTQAHLLEQLPLPAGSQALRLDADWPQIGEQPATAPDNGVLPDNLAYIIYTSGSTGQPKGVMIAHRAVSNFIDSISEQFAMTTRDRVLQFANVCFDVSVFEIFTALTNGATLCLARRETLLSPQELTRLIQQQRITIFDIAPAVMNLLPSEAFTDIRVMFVGCESFSGELVNRWALPGRRFINGYGPTEATVAMTTFECEGHFEESPPIGVPMPNHQVYVLDERLQPVPIGVVGQLYIGGVGLGRGYLNQPALTAEKFLPNPFGGQQGERIYTSGDLVRWLADGNLEFVGRVDQQVKLRGLRIELGEIESALRAHSALRDAVVMVREDPTPTGEATGKRLIAYVIPYAEAPTANELHAFLKTKLPAHMIPSGFVVLDEFPLNSSGKVNRRALPVPQLDNLAEQGEFVEPDTPVERLLAQISKQVLGIEQIGRNDNFFELGGHSLMATQLVSRVRDTFEIDLPLQSMFEVPTVAGLAEQIETLQWASEHITLPDGQIPEHYEEDEI